MKKRTFILVEKIKGKFNSHKENENFLGKGINENFDEKKFIR